MSKITVLAGDYPQCDGEYWLGTITLKTSLKPRLGKSFPVSEFKDLTIKNTFLATLKSGRTLLAATDSDTYQDISARVRSKSLLG